jgi:hypothetical protein
MYSSSLEAYFDEEYEQNCFFIFVNFCVILADLGDFSQFCVIFG